MEQKINGISVGSMVSCKARKATGVVGKINGDTLLIRRDEEYVTTELYGNGEVRMRYDKWVGRKDNWELSPVN